MDEQNNAVQHGAVNFGDAEVPSASALHVPLLTDRGKSSETVVGVISAQSYQANAYGSIHLRALEHFADSVAGWLVASRVVALSSSPENPLSVSPQSVNETAIDLADTVNFMLSGLLEKVAQLRSAVPPASPVSILSEELEEECRRIQVEAVQKLWRLRSQLPDVIIAPQSDFDLTPKEYLVWKTLAQSGDSDTQLAKTLRIQPSTLKFHLRNLYAKLGVENRTQAAKKFAELAISPVA